MYSVVTLGAAYSANKGAASMLQAVVDRLPAAAGPVRFTAVSTHATDDRPALARAGTDVTVVSQRPVELGAVHFPLALLAGALRTARLPWRWLCRPPALRAIAGADVVADISGISFVDGRRKAVLLYNTLVVVVPLLLGRPVVKCAQAMGPIRSPLGRLLAMRVLPRLHTICPRGTATEAHLRERGLTNLVPANDLAFVMDVPDEVRTRMAERLAAIGAGPYVVVSPSQVVATSCDEAGIPYEAIVAGLLDALAEKAEVTPVLVAHSAQPGGVSHMNDLPLCRAIHGRLQRPDGVVFLDEDLLPTELRALIGMSEVQVTSRFHAMISSLTEATPPLVIGWSHKYAEILDPFGLGEVAMTYDDLSGSADEIVDRTLDLLARKDEVADRIRAHLPRAREEAQVNVTVLVDALQTEVGT
jgi:polysaccharide pyruvyl transferase WcaK-like protein